MRQNIKKLNNIFFLVEDIINITFYYNRISFCKNIWNF